MQFKTMCAQDIEPGKFCADLYKLLGNLKFHNIGTY